MLAVGQRRKRKRNDDNNQHDEKEHFSFAQIVHGEYQVIHSVPPTFLPVFN